MVSCYVLSRSADNACTQLHQLLPPILSTLLCASLGPATLPEGPHANASQKPNGTAETMHLRSGTDVRLLAGDLLGRLVTTYGREYETLVPRESRVSWVVPEGRADTPGTGIVGTLVKALRTAPQPNVSKTQPTLRRTPSTSGAQQGGSTPGQPGQTLAAESPTSGRYEGALIALRALGKSAFVEALVGEGGVGLEHFGQVLQGLAEGDRQRLADLTMVSTVGRVTGHMLIGVIAIRQVHLEGCLPVRDTDMAEDVEQRSLQAFGPLFARQLSARPDVARRLVAQRSQ